MAGNNGWSDPMRWLSIVAAMVIAFSGIIYGATGRANDDLSINASRKAQLALEMARDNKTAIKVIQTEMKHQTSLLIDIRDSLKAHTD